MGSNSCSTSSGGVWSLMPYSPSSLSQQKKEGHFILKYPKMVAFSTSRPRKQSRLRESQYFCVTFIKGKTEACRVTDQNVTVDARAARMHKTT